MESQKQTKQTRRTETENHGYGEHFDSCQMGEACGGIGKEVRGLRSTNR